MSTAFIEPPDSIENRIYKVYEDEQDDGLRPHLGASVIGDPCDRKLWYGFRWAMKLHKTGREILLLERGQDEEDRFAAKLRKIGVEVHQIDPRTGKQIRVSLWGGHFGGSLDGVGLHLPNGGNQWHVLEFKTHGKSFEELVKLHVKAAKVLHYCQMQIYMGLMSMHRALYCAVEKRTDALFFERVKYVDAVCQGLIERAKRIIFVCITPPEKISTNPDHYGCQFCDYKHICHFGQPMLRTCRSCQYILVAPDGTWRCNLRGSLSGYGALPILSEKDQLSACVKYEAIKEKTHGNV